MQYLCVVLDSTNIAGIPLGARHCLGPEYRFTSETTGKTVVFVVIARELF
jgi:hypothetical protein